MLHHGGQVAVNHGIFKKKIPMHQTNMYLGPSIVLTLTSAMGFGGRNTERKVGTGGQESTSGEREQHHFVT